MGKRAWTEEEDKLLEELYKNKKSNQEIANILNKKYNDVSKRISKNKLYDKYGSRNFIDLTGQKFGRLTVVKRAENHIKPSGQKATMWLCKCDCGNNNLIKVSSGHLRSGHTTSCGCYNRELSFELNKKQNEYKIWNDIVFVKFSNCNEYFLCDLDDWEKLKDICWYKEYDGYAVNKSSSGIIRMHRVIMNAKDGDIVDHEYYVSNGICDNRKKNLRIANKSQNNVNRNYLNNDHVVGIGYNGYSYTAQISKDNKTIWLGSFTSEDDAIKARLLAEKKYYNEFSPQKHLFEKYGIGDL